MSKQFFKAKPLNEPKEKPPFPREPRKNHNKKYEEKTYQPKDARDHIKELLAAYKALEKPSAVVSDLHKLFPTFFAEEPSKPEPETESVFNDALLFWPKKDPQPKNNLKQMSSDSSDPNWDSDEEKKIKLVSKRIDEQIVKKVTENLSKQPIKKVTDLSKHEREFLEDYEKSAAHKQPAPLSAHTPSSSSKQPNSGHKNKREYQPFEQTQFSAASTPQQCQKQARRPQEVKQPPKEPKEPQVPKQQIKSAQPLISDWQEYTPKVNALIDAGFIQKIEVNEEDQDDAFSMEEGFSFQEEGQKKEKSEASESSSSSEDDDDMLTDDGPRTTVIEKKKNHEKSPNKGLTMENEDHKKFVVKINSQTFTQITDQICVNPLACNWVISDKVNRYKVTTQYMDQIYVSQELHKMLPYISLNYSDFVHYDDIDTEKAVEKFKRHFNSNANSNRRYFQGKYDHHHHNHSNSHHKQNPNPNQNQNQNGNGKQNVKQNQNRSGTIKPNQRQDNPRKIVQYKPRN